MATFVAPTYTADEIAELGLESLSYPYSGPDATYIGIDHQYELTEAYFEERGRSLQREIEGNSPDKVKNFLRYLRMKVYTYVYTHNKSSKDQLNFMIAKRGLRTYDIAEYRQTFLEAMYIEGCYLLDNGDLSAVAGVDLDTMQNMSADVMRNQNRDWHKDAICLLTTLGLNYYGRYLFYPIGKGKEW